MKTDTAPQESIDTLKTAELSTFVIDMFHRIIMHYAMWFREVEHQFGSEKAMTLLDDVLKRTYSIQMKRLSEVIGFTMEGDVPSAMLEMPREKLIALSEAVGKNWLANDGVWFQAVEGKYGMNDAKRCNDSCWAHFSPLEAWSIKRFLGLEENPGLEGLKRALRFRMYARINEQSITDEQENSFVFQMNNCRVQAARKRKGLDDYPCKSGGLVEYAFFAESIDPRIGTECIGCPPDDHPDDWFCAWRFYLK